jgi:SAM-dependent methyltransferase
VRKIARLAPLGGRALDVGAGVGRMVHELVRAGLDAYGVEPDEARAAEAGARVACGTLANVPDGEPFDLVIFWHTLEHHERPFEALVRAGVHMRPGAALVVAVPNAGSWQARLAGPKWLHLDLPHHRAHFTKASLSALVVDAGFALELVRTGQVEMDLAGMVDAFGAVLGLPLQFAFDALRRPDGRGAARRARRVAGLAFLALALPFAALACAVARLAGRAGTLILVARRADARSSPAEAEG